MIAWDSQPNELDYPFEQMSKEEEHDQYHHQEYDDRYYDYEEITYLVGVRGVYEVILDQGTMAFFEAIRGIEKQYNEDVEDYILPPYTGKKPTLVLDMDETLIHAAIDCIPIESYRDYYAEELNRGWDFFFCLPYIDDQDSHTIVNVKKRKGVDMFLEKMSKHFELVLWTAGDKVYADCILDRLDPNGYISHRLYREHCTVLNIDNGVYMKNLKRLGRNMRRTLILENSPRNFGFQIDNGIPITSFEAYFDGDVSVFDETDEKLLELTPLLMDCRNDDDLVDCVINWFKIREVSETAALISGELSY